MDEESLNNAAGSENEELETSGDETIEIQFEEDDSRSLSPVEENNVSAKRKKLNKFKTTHRKYLKGLNQKTMVTKKRINTLINTIRVLRQHCKDLPIKDEKLHSLCMVNESDCDDTSSDEEHNAPIQTLKDVKDLNYQEQILNECNSAWANSVQVTLLGPEKQDKKMKSLEKKVEMAAERDVALSQELLMLKNNIFLKTKHIEDLKNDVARLKEEAETQIFGP